jgi:hypothetical protein
MTRILFSTDYFSFEKDNNDIINFIRSGDAVVVVPLSHSGQVLLVKECTSAFGGEAQADTANRELQENLGYRVWRMNYINTIVES